ncbi:MAG: hypothetical protein KAS30_05460, partial [Candidatus Diapherotrites archaeon]|nr:hypothetical protein [Candidatus Diapherotrites archaeon]
TYEELLASGNIKSEWMNSTDLFFTDDRMTLTMFNNATRDNDYFSGFTKEGSYSDAIIDASSNVSRSKSLYYDLDSEEALDKCGWYKMKLKPVLSYSEDEISFNDYQVFVETTYVGETQACSANPLHITSLLPWNNTSKFNIFGDETAGLVETRNVVLVADNTVNKQDKHEIASVLSGVDLETFNIDSANLLKGHESQKVEDASNSDKNVFEIRTSDRSDLDLGMGDELTQYYGVLPVYGVLSYDSSESDSNIKNHFVLDIVNDPFEDMPGGTTQNRPENDVNFTWDKALSTIITGGQVDGCLEPEGPDSNIKRFVITGMGESGGDPLDALSRNTCVYPTGGLLRGLAFDSTDRNTLVVTDPDVLTHLIACECGAALLNADTDAGRFGATGYNIRYEPENGGVFNKEIIQEGLARLKEDGSEPASVFCVNDTIFGGLSGGDCTGCPPQIIWDEQVGENEDGISSGITVKPIISVEEKGLLSGSCKSATTACLTSAVTTGAKLVATPAALTPPGVAIAAGVWIVDMAVDGWAM